MSSTPRKLELVTEVPERAMVVFAHPDDAEIGAGGVIAKWIVAGCEVTYVLCTNGDSGTADRSLTPDELVERRAREQRAAADFMGVKHVVMLGYPDGELEDTRAFLGDVVRVLRRYRPDTVFVHDPFRTKGFQHRDHRKAGIVTQDAVYPYARDHLHFPEHVTQEGLEPHKVRELWFWGADEPEIIVDVSESIDRQIAALVRHESQVPGFNVPPGQTIGERVKRHAADNATGYDFEYGAVFRRLIARRWRARGLIRKALLFVLALGVVALSVSPLAMAQQGAKIIRIGAVSAGAPRTSPHWVAFEQRLRELGYANGANASIEFRSAEGKPERFPGLLADLVRSNVDVILAVGPEASLRAAKEATTTIPIVAVAIDYDPIARGYVAGLARPGGNITGVFLRQPELTAKRVELLREVVPKVRRMAIFWDVFSADQLGEAEAVAGSLGIQLQRFEFREPPYRFDAPMREAVRQHAGALLGLASPIFFRQRAELAQLAIKNHLPAVVPFREAAEAGLLMAYGADLPDMLRRAAEYVDKILKGAKPADLPMEQPTKFELVINLKTAKMLGLVIPPALLLRADYTLR